MKKRLIVLFDGTWNTRDDRTNVARMADAVAKEGFDGVPQEKWYDRGPGTNWYDRLRGGAFGYGLSENIREAYAWLAGEWAKADDNELYVFGFSRGAYTARSLVGLIRKSGLLKKPAKELVEQAYALYRNKDLRPDSQEAAAFRATYSREIRVKFVGVWDTVGSLGVPFTGALVPWGRDHYQWHDTELSKIVDYAYHALAVDERRKDYEATVWTKRKPENQDVEQRWFIGAHANVGGGYKYDRLHNIPLRWMQDKAVACGLGLKELRTVEASDYRAKVADSFGDFMFGLYKAMKFGKPFERPFGTGVNETVDDSVWQRWNTMKDYRPPSLLEEAKKRGLA
ncbi:DUF2235 domain-containing protein [Nitrospira moscoviensis]|uniref:T6SS Phospholipase effector Tle1-like catalytic domain-containing protein n=1 Tax=Nitrospira moscoviensis TaxID=42253 RepID=A0A0K2GA44_NITMO|nr:DUF2235 domain-containing protein [Nitrospira moscoviensis]ALA57823.1 hypothetical protein NITMOv2_1396 [Nitrospira moscoviensis]